jgi:hypothetical protein
MLHCCGNAIHIDGPVNASVSRQQLNRTILRHFQDIHCIITGGRCTNLPHHLVLVIVQRETAAIVVQVEIRSLGCGFLPNDHFGMMIPVVKKVTLPLSAKPNSYPLKHAASPIINLSPATKVSPMHCRGFGLSASLRRRRGRTFSKKQPGKPPLSAHGVGGGLGRPWQRAHWPKLNHGKPQ